MAYSAAMPTYTVTHNEISLSVLEFLQRRIPGASSGYLRQLLKKGKVSSAGGALTEHTPLSAGLELSVPDSGRLLELSTVAAEIAGEAVTVLYESREMLVVDKPAGLAIHRGVGHEGDNLTARIETLFKKRGDAFKVAPIHRLDVETSGPVLFGKGKQACRQLGALFMQHEVEKVYLALVEGQMAGSGVLCSSVAAKGKPKDASTAFCALHRSEQASLLRLTLYTGRQHQIRRQLASFGHPLFGDCRYGGSRPADLPRIFLHCCRLAFVDPFSGAAVAINCPLPADLSHFLTRCAIPLPAQS